MERGQYPPWVVLAELGHSPFQNRPLIAERFPTIGRSPIESTRGHCVADEERERSAGPQIRLGGLAPTAATQMRPQQEPSTHEVLAGFVERVTFHNSENGFCVLRAKARGHRDLVTVIGHAATISAGEWITASGEWVNDHTHGQQFKARFMRTSAPTSIEGIEKYLGSGMIRGIGPVYAKKLVRAFGEKVFDTIEAEP